MSLWGQKKLFFFLNHSVAILREKKRQIKKWSLVLYNTEQQAHHLTVFHKAITIFYIIKDNQRFHLKRFEWVPL